MDLSNLSKETLITIIEDQQKLINEQQKKINSYKIPQQPVKAPKPHEIPPEDWATCVDCNVGGCMGRIVKGANTQHSRCGKACKEGEALCKTHTLQYNKEGNKKLRNGWYGVYGAGCINADDYGKIHQEWAYTRYFWAGEYRDIRPAWVQEKYPLQ